MVPGGERVACLQYRSIHFVGIKGTGMSAVARICKANGIEVTGSDVDETFPTDAGLRASGIVPYRGFSAENVGSPDLVVASAAYGPDHPEIVAARQRGIPVLSYPEFLGRMMAEKCGVAVAGTHGKTTTTAMLAHVLDRAGLDPQAVIGIGEAYTGRGELLIAESCEYRRHFLNYPARIAIVTNIELDHPDYYRSIEDYEAAFREFAGKLPPDGLLICCGDDARARALPTLARKITYGFGTDNDYQLELLPPGEGNRYRVYHLGELLGEFKLGIPGGHNALNSLAVIALARELGVSVATLRDGLASFRGVRRRFEYIGEFNGASIYDDYAHHPTAIAATVAACRAALPGRRVWVAFQPHTYSRTKALLAEFAAALASADRVIVAEIYASARERGRADISSRDIVARIAGGPEKAVFFPTFDEIVTHLRAALRPGDVLITMGAGDIYRVGYALAGRSESVPQ